MTERDSWDETIAVSYDEDDAVMLSPTAESTSHVSVWVKPDASRPI